MLSSSAATAETLERFYDELKDIGTSPLWLVQEEALVAEPKSKALPFLWRWRDLKPQALRAGELDRHRRCGAPGPDATEPWARAHRHHKLAVLGSPDRDAR